jgi:ABC-2 type transport system permease protein
LTRTDRFSALALAAGLSVRDFFAVYPPRVYFLTTLPRAVLQVTFLALVGYYAAGEEGREFAFVGACAQIIVLATVVRAPDVVVDERIMGTLYRVRLGCVPLPAIAAARWTIYVCAGVVDALVAAVLAGMLVGEADVVPELLAAGPLLLLIAMTTSALGLAVAGLSLTQRVDVHANLVAYLTMVFCGVVAPISVFGDVGETLVRLIPLTNGLLAIREFLAGEPWLASAGLEVVVGLGWALAAVLLILVQNGRARRFGTDDLL